MDVELLAGTKLGNYEIEALLGKGGMGIVYKAKQTSLDRPVALKFLSSALVSNIPSIKRFKREARAVARLNHHNIIRVYDIAEEKELHFFSMEYIDGKTLDQLLEEEVVLSFDKAVDIVVQAALALEHAHNNGIMHRDIKPSNIILDANDNVKVMDFGLAMIGDEVSTLTTPGALIGTTAYMSPEQCEGEQLDYRTDIYSLGVVLFEMLAGAVPFHAESIPALVHKIVYEEPPELRDLNPDVPSELGDIVTRAMAKNKADRYATVPEFLKDLQAFKHWHSQKHTPVRKRKDTRPITMAPMEERIAPHAIEQTPFVGRKNERDELQRFLVQAEHGRGSLIMIGGEPGIGKTRLVEELSAEAGQRGFLSLTGHCYEMKGTAPYIPFVEILETTTRLVRPNVLLEILGDSAPEVARLMPGLRRIFPDLPPPAELPPEQERRYMFNSLLEFIERAANIQPILLILEDLHWADDSTLLLLSHIAQQLHLMPVIVIGTYRDTELKTTVSLARTMEELLRQRLAHDILLGRLSEPDVSAMLVGRSAKEVPRTVLQLVYRETEGNPFFVEEIFKHLTEEKKLFNLEGQWRTDLRIEEASVPRGVRLVVGHRLERISRQCYETLTAAAAIGRAVSFELLVELVKLDEDELIDVIEEAEKAQLIRSTTGVRDAQFTFAHELIRQTLLSNLSTLRRQRLHLRLADAIERVYASSVDEHATDLAYHLYQAGALADVKKAIRYLTRAGEKAFNAAAFEEALRLYDNAYSLKSFDDVRAQADLLYKRGLAQRSLGRWEESLADWHKVLAIYEQLDDAEATGQMRAAISNHYFRSTRIKEAYEIAQHGLDQLGERVSPARCLLLAAAGRALGHLATADYDTIHDLLGKAHSMAEELGDKRVLGSVLLRMGILNYSFWRSQEQIDIGLQAAKVLRSSGNVFETAGALMTAHWGFIQLGRFDEAETIAVEAESTARRIGNNVICYLVQAHESLRLMALAVDLDTCEKKLTALLDFAQTRARAWISFAYAYLGRTQFLRGYWAEAQENLEKGKQLELPGAYSGQCSGQYFLFSVYAGHRDTALEMLKDRGHLLSLPGPSKPLGSWAMLEAAIEGLTVLGERDEAARLYPLALEAISSGNVLRSSCAGLVQTMAGLAAAAGCQWDKAEEHYQAALRQSHEIPHVLDQPEIRRWYACMLIERNASGDKEKARTLLAEAVGMYRDIGMPRHLEMAEQLLKSA